MISLENLTTALQDKLNESTLAGVKFNIVTDTGEFKESERKGNAITQYINGVMRCTSSEVTTLSNGVLFATMSCNLSIIVDLADEEKDEVITFSNGKTQTVIGYENQIKSVRESLVSIFQSNTVSDITDTDGNSYTVSAIYQLPTSGLRGMEQKVGDSFTFNVYILYLIVEDGINTRNSVFTFDGLTLPYQSMTINRAQMQDGYVFANSQDGTTKNLTAMSMLTLTFELPALKDNITSEIMNFVRFGNLNEAHILTYYVNGEEKFYLVSLSEANEIGETMKNVGQKISFTEIPKDYELVNIGSRYAVYYCSAPISTLTFVGQAKTFVFGTNIFSSTNSENVAKTPALQGNIIISTTSVTDIVAGLTSLNQLYDITITAGTSQLGITCTAVDKSSRVVAFSGTAENNDSRIFFNISDDLDLLPGVYTMAKGGGGENVSLALELAFGDGIFYSIADTAETGADDVTFTLTEHVTNAHLYIAFQPNQTYNVTLFPRLNKGNTVVF